MLSTPSVTFQEPLGRELEPKTDEIACNCWAFVRSQIPAFPNTKDLKPNIETPHNGDVVIMSYPHYAIIVNSSDEGVWIKDANWGGCGYRKHFIKWDDPRIIGFWTAQ